MTAGTPEAQPKRDALRRDMPYQTSETVIPDLIRDPYSVSRSHEPRAPPQPRWIPALRFAAAGMTRKRGLRPG
jgi:hypothetical protein